MKYFKFVIPNIIFVWILSSFIKTAPPGHFDNPWHIVGAFIIYFWFVILVILFNLFLYGVFSLFKYLYRKLA
jgi:hypothetical protein